MLFASDDELLQPQRRLERVPRGLEIPAADLRREAIENARELRAHQRWREFAFLLLVAPVLFAVFDLIVRSLVPRLAGRRT